MSAQPHVEEFLGLTAIFHSPAIRRVLDLARRFADCDGTVLVEGESGSGKEVVARAIHHCSQRRAKPWVDVSCGALPENLVESELFGYEKGAFSGADSRKPGLFEMADQGTIFLDEIGELEPRLQVKLLRVLDCGSYYKLGGTKKVSVNVRVVTATNRDLDTEVREGRFRKDLYHRLAYLRIVVPPLRDRAEDVIPLAELFLRTLPSSPSLSEEAMRALIAHTWPGNIRELRNVVLLSAVVAEDNVIRLKDLPAALQRGAPSEDGISGSLLNFAAAVSSGGMLEEAEKQLILKVLAQTGGHHLNAARLLGISSRTLTRKLKLYQGRASQGGTSC